jgi:hypothetical protein
VIVIATSALGVVSAVVVSVVDSVVSAVVVVVVSSVELVSSEPQAAAMSDKLTASAATVAPRLEILT